MPAREFVDTNILIYSLAPNDPRHATSIELLSRSPRVSVQVLNEFVNVARRKLRLAWGQIENALAGFQEICGTPRPLDHATHRTAVAIARRYEYRICDALILAAALEAGCTTLYSEDMQHGQRIDALTIRNPFLQD